MLVQVKYEDVKHNFHHGEQSTLIPSGKRPSHRPAERETGWHSRIGCNFDMSSCKSSELEG